MRCSSTSCERSPTVSTSTYSASMPSIATTRSACQRARRLPRVATRSRSRIALVLTGIGQVEERGERIAEVVAAAGAGRVLHPHGRLVQQLVDDAARQPFDRVSFAGI